MKTEKVCINKSLAFIVAVVAVLLGVVLFANYMNSQNYSTGSKAATPAQTCKQMAGSWYIDADCDVASSRVYPSQYANGVKMLTLVASTPSDAQYYTGKVCCKLERMPTPDPALEKGKCKVLGGLWYDTRSYSDCSKVGANFEVPTGLTETNTGYVCCRSTRLPTPTPGGKTCKQLGGTLVNTGSQYATYQSCADMGSNWKDNSVAVDLTTGWSCCVQSRLPTPTTGQDMSCRTQGGRWYGDASCDKASERAYPEQFAQNYMMLSPVANPASDASLYANSVCCKLNRMPTPTP